MTVVRVLIPLILTGVMVFSIVDIVTIDPGRVRHLPKGFWLILVIVLSFVGSMLWFGVGRESLAAASSAGPRPAGRRSGPVAPDDDPEFLRRIQRERDQAKRIEQLEKRLAELDDGASDPPE